MSNWIRFGTILFLIIFASTIGRAQEAAINIVKEGIAKGKVGDYEGAIVDFTKGIEIKPDYANAYNDRANAEAAKHKYHEASVDFDKAIELNPNSALFFSNRGRLRIILKDLNGAVADCTKAIQLDSSLANAYFYRGHAEVLERECNSALRDMNKTIELNPTGGAGERIAAIRVYREIHHVGLAEAKKTIDDLCSAA